jgi:hypothetical protein
MYSKYNRRHCGGMPFIFIMNSHKRCRSFRSIEVA